MKRILIAISVVFLFFICQTSLTSCEKETVTVTVRDTIIIRDTVPPTPLTNTQILAKYTWQVDEVYAFIGGETKHYKKGGENTIGANYTALRFTFNTDETGSHTDALGGIYPATWSFTTTDQKNMEFKYATLTHKWAITNISEEEFLATTWSSGSLSSTRLIPVP